jgi:4-amino-4-deoxy-L-arabinose transferase-like glycosyltransferase
LRYPLKRSLVLVGIFAVLWFASLDCRRLVQPDEGRYAEIAREMVVSGDWLTPRLNGIKYFEKPPLQYWATALAYLTFGKSEWSARFWTGLTGFLGVLVLGYGGARLFGARTGLMSALILASCIYYSLLGHINTLDMGLTFFLLLSLIGFLLAQHEHATPAQNRNWMLTAWAAMALAVLSKGLVGIVLPGTTLLLYALVERDGSLFKRLHLLAGPIVFLAIAAPWFVEVARVNPEFTQFFFVHEHLQRFTSNVHRRVQPFWFFVPLLLFGLLPWLGLLPSALLQAWRKEAPQTRFSVTRFLLCFSAVIFIFFSASGSKLPAYILPLFPALALLMGKRLAQDAKSGAGPAIPGSSVRAGFPIFATFPILIPGLLSAAAYLAGLLAGRMADNPVERALFDNFSYWLIAAAAVMFAGSLYYAWQLRRGRCDAAVIGFAFAALAAAQIANCGYGALAPSNSAHDMAQRIKPLLLPRVPIYSVGMYDQTLNFYLDRTVTLVDYSDELGFGLEQEPALGIPTLDAFKREWAAHPEAWAVMPPHVYASLQQSHFPMRLVARDTRRVIVRPS